jgi:hypothetical protein
MYVSRPVNTKVELQLDVSGSTWPGDNHEIGRLAGHLGVPGRPVGEGAVDVFNLKQDDMDLRGQRDHPGLSRAMGENDASGLGQARNATGYAQIEAGVLHLVVLAAVGRHNMANSG